MVAFVCMYVCVCVCMSALCTLHMKRRTGSKRAHDTLAYQHSALFRLKHPMLGPFGFRVGETELPTLRPANNLGHGCVTAVFNNMAEVFLRQLAIRTAFSLSLALFIPFVSLN